MISAEHPPEVFIPRTGVESAMTLGKLVNGLHDGSIVAVATVVQREDQGPVILAITGNFPG